MNPTKIIVVLASVCAVVLAQELSDDQIKSIMGYHTECKEETNVDDNMALGMLTGNFPDDPVLKSHLFCMSKKLGTQSDDGEIIVEKVKEMIRKVVSDEDKVTQLAESCSVVKDSPDDTAFELTKCIYEGTH